MTSRKSRKPLDLSTGDGLTELEEIVRDRVGGHLREFRLTVVEGGLVLRGRAPTYYSKQLAQHAVMQETDVPIVTNEIEVY